MMAVTHSAIACAGTSLILGTSDPMVLGLSIIGSQLPDLDTSTSLIGQVCFPVSSWIEDRYPHRSITHCFLASVFLLAASFGACHFLLGVTAFKLAIALPLGHLLSVFADTFTKQGVQLFFPNPVWCVCGSNPKRRLTTGGTGEYWVLAGAVGLLLFSINLTNSGGIVQSATQGLGLRSGIVQSYNQTAGSNLVYAHVRGVLTSDRSPVDDRFLILGNEGSEFVLWRRHSTRHSTYETGKTPSPKGIHENGEISSQHIYKTGENIIVDSLKTEVGSPADTRIITISFDDEAAVTKLEELRTYPGQIFLTGSLTIDFPEDVAIELQPDQLRVLEVTGSTVTLNYCPLDKAIAALREQYSVGSLEVKIISSQVG